MASSVYQFWEWLWHPNRKMTVSWWALLFYKLGLLYAGILLYQQDRIWPMSAWIWILVNCSWLSLVCLLWLWAADTMDAKQQESIGGHFVMMDLFGGIFIFAFQLADKLYCPWGFWVLFLLPFFFLLFILGVALVGTISHGFCVCVTSMFCPWYRAKLPLTGMMNMQAES